MSAFLVEPKTINKIASFAFSPRGKEYYEFHEELDKLNLKTPEELAEALYALNVNGITERYGQEEKERGEDGLIYYSHIKYQPEYNHTTISVFKSLNCLHYQCAEGRNVEKKLYKALEDWGNTIAHRIVNDLPEYDRENWG